MIKQVTKWEDSFGKTHDTEEEALLADFNYQLNSFIRVEDYIIEQVILAYENSEYCKFIRSRPEAVQ